MENNTLHKLGIDIGSTTVKVAVLDMTICSFPIMKDILPTYGKRFLL
jgi:activator of 2-hydroxyglutaryl-CoA dehydratase